MATTTSTSTARICYQPTVLLLSRPTLQQIITEILQYAERLGGLNNDNGKQYMIVFEHVDKQLGNLYIIIVGSNSNGLSMAFAKDNTTKLEPEFSAVPQDTDGTLCMIAWPKEYTPGGE